VIGSLLLRGSALGLALAASAGLARAAQEAPPPASVERAPERDQERGQERSGPPIVQGIVVEGEKRYTESQLAAVLGQTIGKPRDNLAIDRGLERLWISFHVRGSVQERDVPGGVELRLVVEEMPVDREPRFVGNESIDEKTLRRWAQLEERSELYLHQAGRVRQRLLENYRREGYHHAEVNVLTREDTPGALPDVIFEIREGRKVRVEAVRIRGNESMPDERFLYFFRDGLSKFADRQLYGPTLFNWLGSKFVEEELEADLLAMRNVYRDRGWLDAVVELERLEFGEDRSRVTIHLVIDEGPRYRVSSVSIKAVDWARPDAGDEELVPAQLIVPEQELLALCDLDAGDFYEAALRQADAAELRRFYAKRGHVSHPSLPRRLNWRFLGPELAVDPLESTVAVTYRIVQGRELHFREILFDGTTHTRDRVLRRELSVFEGQRADLTEVERSLSRIYATGYFSDQFNVARHRAPSFRFVPVEGEPGLVDLEFVVDEGRVINFQINGGVGSDDGAFAAVQLQMNNFDAVDVPDRWGDAIGEIYRKEAFHGAGQVFNVLLMPGTEISQFSLHFSEPDLFRTHLRPTSISVDLQKRNRIYRSHDEEREQVRVTLGRKFDFDIRGSVGVTFGNVELDDLDDDGVPPSLDFQHDRGETSLTGITLALSTRSLDDVMAPHDGYSLSLRNTFYTAALGGDYDITAAELDADFYKSVGELADGTKPVIHLGIGAGAMQPYDDTLGVPYSERYFLGGREKTRGFGFRGIGPVDPLSDYPLGGETMFYGTLEYLHPLYSITQPGTYKKIEALRMGLFCDVGVLDPESWHLDFDELRASVGFGFALTAPYPIGIDFGFPIRDFDGDDRQTFTFRLWTP
jgi:outer membrane protein insertion porin family